jgi:hypothetical protein
MSKNPDYGLWERTAGDTTVRREADSPADAVYLKFEGWRQVERGELPDPDAVEAAARSAQPAAHDQAAAPAEQPAKPK